MHPYLPLLYLRSGKRLYRWCGEVLLKRRKCVSFVLVEFSEVERLVLFMLPIEWGCTVREVGKKPSRDVTDTKEGLEFRELFMRRTTFNGFG